MQLPLEHVALLMDGVSDFIRLISLDSYGFVADAADWPIRNGRIMGVLNVALRTTPTHSVVIARIPKPQP